jgi:hypothetical protein
MVAGAVGAPAAEAAADAGAGTQRRGRPRSEASRAAILAAASELVLEHGLGAISMDAVAERAGASKATIYRTAVACDGPLAGDLLALMRPWVRQLAKRDYGRIVAGLLSKAQGDEEFAAAYRERFVEPRRAAARAVLAAAIERGEIGRDVDVEAAIDLLYGPFYHRLLHRHAPLSDAFTRTIVGYVVAALGADGAR